MTDDERMAFYEIIERRNRRRAVKHALAWAITVALAMLIVIWMGRF